MIALKSELPKRKEIRLKQYDYTTCGAYFVTICVADRHAMLWELEAAERTRSMMLSEYGKVVEAAVLSISKHYENVEVDKYCIMPDHVHLILMMYSGKSGRMISAPTPTLSTIIGMMKRSVSKEIGFSFWQKSFYDRIIRNEEEYRNIWKYIDENPIKYRVFGEHANTCLP